MRSARTGLRIGAASGGVSDPNDGGSPPHELFAAGGLRADEEAEEALGSFVR